MGGTVLAAHAPDAGGRSWLTLPSRALTGLVLPLGLLALWEFASTHAWLPPQILPSPSDVWSAGLDSWNSGELPGDIGISLQRVLEGFAAGAVVGLALGTTMGLSRAVDDLVRPLFTAIAQIPSLGWIPFLMMIFGIGEILKVVVIAKAAFVPMVLNAANGVRNVPRGYMEVADALLLTRWQRLRLLVIPAAMPPIFAGIRYGLTHAWLALVAVELLASSEGLGYLLVYGRQMFWLDTVLIAMAVIGLIGFALDKALEILESRMQRWQVGA